MIYYVGIEKCPGNPYQIGVYKTRHQLMRGQARDHYEAKTVEELLELLADIYSWPSCCVAPEKKLLKEITKGQRP